MCCKVIRFPCKVTIPLVQSDPSSMKRLHIVQTKKGCPLTFEERLGCSAIIYRTRTGQVATGQALSRPWNAPLDQYKLTESDDAGA